MTVEQLIEKLRTLPHDAVVEVEIVEPYDDDAATLRENVTAVRIEGGVVVLA